MTTFNEYRKNQEQLRENTLYTDPATKKAFLDDEKAIMSAFMFNFFGMLLGYNLVKNKQKVLAYFRNDLKLQLGNISDSNNNISLIIKILDDKGAFKSATTSAQITRFLVKLKQNSIDSVDSDILIGWMSGIKDTFWTKLGSHLKIVKEEFMVDKDQYKAFETLRARARLQKDVSEDFFNTFKGQTVDPTKITKWSPDMLSKKSIDARLANIGGLVAATAAKNHVDHVTPPQIKATPVPAFVAAVTPKPQPVEKKPWPGAQVIVDYFINGGKYEDLNKYYKSVVDERRGTIGLALRQVFLDVPEEKLVELSKFIIANTTAKYQAQYIGEAIENTFRSSPISEKPLNRLVIAQNLGLLEPAHIEMSSGRYRYALNTIFSTVVKEIFDFGATSRLRDIKNIVAKIDSKYLFPLQYVSANHKFIYEYIRSKTIDDFIKANTGKITVIDGINTIKYTAEEDKFDYDNAVIKKIMSEYHLERQSNDNIIVAYIAQAPTNYGYGYELNRVIKTAFGDGPYNEDISKNIRGQFVKSIEAAHTDVQAINIIKSLFGYLLEYNQELINNEIIDTFFKTVKEKASQVPSIVLIDLFEYVIRASNDVRFDQIITTLLAAIFTDTAIDFDNLLRRVKNAHSARNNAMVNFIRIVRNNSVLKEKAAAKIIQTALGNILNDYYNTVYTHINQRNNTWDILTSVQQEKLLNDIIITISKHDRITDGYRARVAVSSVLGDVKGANSEFMYSNMNDEAKTAYKFIYTKTATLTLADGLFFKELDDSALQAASFGTLNSALTKLDDEAKTDVYNRFFAKQENKASLTNSVEPTSLITILKINEYTDVFKDDIDTSIDTVFKHIRDSKRHHYATDVLQSINNQTYGKISQEQKDKVFQQTLNLIDDPKWIKKQTSAYKDNAPTVQAYFDNMVETNRAKAEEIYKTMTDNMRMRMAESYLTRSGFSNTVEGLLHNDESPIAPYEKLDKKRINEILKYNNVTSSETNIPSKYIKTFDTMDEYVKNIKDNKYTVNKLEGQKVQELKQTQEELDRISVDLHRTKRNGKHGDITLKVIRSFKVSIPIQEEEQKAWIEAKPEQEIINPMFHGTGSIGASMILRYGFRVIKSGDSLVVGRMLGDGIYGSNIIDKAQQYVGDKGFGRNVGLKGYIFKMNAALGEKNTDYKVAGLGNDSIRSPEWCVFTPNAQFKIYQAYEVELISRNEMDDLLKKYPNIVTEKSFKDYLNEKIEEQVNYTTYTFINGIIPNGPNPENIVDFADWKSPSERITLEPSAYGPTVVVAGTEESKDYTFTSVVDFRINFPKEYEKFIRYFK